MGNPIEIGYSFSFESGATKVVNVALDRQTLGFIPKKRQYPLKWTELNHNKCRDCSLDEGANKYCPVALNLSYIAEKFKDFASCERVVINVTTRERIYSKYTSLQEGLSALTGIVMVTSGCPTLDYLRPMVRFHLPFATVAETVYRMVSTYVMGQFLSQRKGGEADWKLEGLEKIYSEIHEVNKDFARRIADTAKKDANVNAIMNLDCFACLVPLTAEEMIKEIELNFQPYTKITPL
ncbi:MAG: hypothetical protein AAB275_02390 [Deltaproteobacteria bacterium]